MCTRNKIAILCLRSPAARAKHTYRKTSVDTCLRLGNAERADDALGGWAWGAGLPWAACGLPYRMCIPGHWWLRSLVSNPANSGDLGEQHFETDEKMSIDERPAAVFFQTKHFPTDHHLRVRGLYRYTLASVVLWPRPNSKYPVRNVVQWLRFNRSTAVECFLGKRESSARRLCPILDEFKTCFRPCWIPRPLRSASFCFIMYVRVRE